MQIVEELDESQHNGFLTRLRTYLKAFFVGSTGIVADRDAHRAPANG